MLPSVWQVRKFRLNIRLIWRRRLISDQGLTDLIDDCGPVSRQRLPKEPKCGIPGAVAAAQQPAPLIGKGEQQPDWFAKGAGHVGDRGVDGEDEVQLIE